MGIGRLNNTWKKVAFFFHKRAFESKLEGILSAAAGHEGNSLPAGSLEFRVLAARADELCAEFADSWGLDVDLVKARVPGLAKLAGMAAPPPTRNYARLAWLGALSMPVAFFLIGVIAGLVSLGFHLVGGR
jgi:hypothetical protein